MIRAIVTDIEGTTSSLSFVKEVLFPYASNHLRQYILENRERVRPLLDEAKQIAGGVGDDDEIIDVMLRWIAEDRKVTPLKALQGLVWEEGYARGDYFGHIYDDAAEKLAEWKQTGIHLYVYSSGSIHAQKLLFAHTERGDLTPLFSGYFDTTTGGKKEAASYQKIADAIGEAPASILFLSDILEELDAAKSAGMQTIQLVREGQPHGDHEVVSDFSTISLS